MRQVTYMLPQGLFGRIFTTAQNILARGSFLVGDLLPRQVYFNTSGAEGLGGMVLKIISTNPTINHLVGVGVQND